MMDGEIEYQAEKRSFIESGLGAIDSIPWMLILIIVVVFLVITSDVFIDDVLAPTIPNSVNSGIPNTKGSLIQAGIMGVTALVFGFIEIRNSHRE